MSQLRLIHGKPLFTYREREVIAHLFEAESIKQIACSLHIAENTVKQSIDRIKCKLRIDDTRFSVRARIIWLLSQDPQWQEVFRRTKFWRLAEELAESAPFRVAGRNPRQSGSSAVRFS